MKKLALVMMACFASSCFASSINTTKITRVLVGPGVGKNVMLTISPRPTNLPDCQTNQGYNYVFDGTTEVGKMTLGAVLTAYAAKSNVWLGGTGSCSLYNTIENLKHIVIK